MSDEYDVEDGEIERCDDYGSVSIELDEDHMEGLRHGSGSTFDFGGEDGQTFAVHVDRADKDIDKEWLLGEDDTELPDVHECKAVAGIAAVMVGVGQAAVSFVDVAPQVTGGVLAVFGGIYVIDQMRAVRDASESGCSA